MPGKVVNFYSPVEEPGRSIALKNTAWVLASHGRSVLALDWELSSPSLHHSLGSLLDWDVAASKKGVADLFGELAIQAGERVTPSVRKPYVAQTMDGIFQLKGPAGPGRISLLLGASTQGTGGAQYDWNKFHNDQLGLSYAKDLREALTAKYEFVLVNCGRGRASRSGAMLLPDIAVMCFRMDDNSVDDASAAATKIAESVFNLSRPKKRPVTIPVRVEVDVTNPVRLRENRRLVRGAFAALVGLDDTDTAEYDVGVEIPMHGYGPADSAASTPARSSTPEQAFVLAAYQNLAEMISGVSATSTREPDVRADVVVSHSSADQLWAEWIAHELSSGGLRVHREPLDLSHTIDGARSVLSESTRLIVVHSATYARLPLRAQMASLVRDNPNGVLARIDDTPVSEGFALGSEINLRDGEIVALAELRRCFGLAERSANQLTETEAPRWAPRFPRDKPEILNDRERLEDFTGRESVLARLRIAFTAVEKDAAPQVLVGPPGVGKTSLAHEYAHRFAADYDIIWWVSAESRELAHAGLYDLARELKLTVASEQAIARLLEWLHRKHNTKRWLIIFDSVDNPTDIDSMIPVGAGHVLITSTLDQWDHVSSEVPVEVVPLQVFEPSEAVQLLHSRLRGLSDGDARRLSEQLGRIPIAVNCVSLFLSFTELPVSEYLQRHKLSGGDSMDPEAKVTATLAVSLAEVHQRMPAAARAFAIFSFMAPEPITKHIYQSRFLTDELARIDPSLGHPDGWGKMLNLLRRTGLASVDLRTRHIMILRHVQDLMRKSQSAEEIAGNKALALKTLASANPMEPDLSLNDEIYKALWPHAVASSELLETELPQVHGLVVDLIRYRYKAGDYAGSEELAGEAMARWEDRPGPDSDEYNRACMHRARALRRMPRGILDARALDEKTLARLRANADGLDQTLTLMVQSGLATDLRALGKYQQALELDKGTVAEALLIWGEYHPFYLNFRNNLATSHRMVGNAKEAEEIDRDTYEHRCEALAEDHPHRASSANSLGRDLRDLGRLTESKKCLAEALAMYERIHGGSQHPDTLRASKNLAVTLRRLGEFDAALDRAIQTDSGCSAILGANHPDTLICHMTVATIYSAMGRHEEAMQYAHEAVDGFAEALEPDSEASEHVYSAIARNNRATICLRADRIEFDQAYLRSLRQALETSLGAQHWIVGVVEINLANHLAASGDPAAARAFDTMAYERISASLGNEHPDAIGAANNVSCDYSVLEEMSQADEWLTKAETAAVKFGSGHPLSQAIRDKERWTYTFIDPPPLT